MGKNSNVHKRKTFHEADLEREREEEVRRAAKRKKMQAKKLQKVLQAKMPPSALPQAAAPMELERTTGTSLKPRKVGDAKRPFGAKLSGVVKKRKKSKETKIHKRQLLRATEGKDMEL
mmetsp:Transcript_16451/g.33214  ORF Transcript_16451/g.33214 Transcript_16451/m.33214 type:complete len:118 (-) Transcript_16451:170-523(-)|eukprot:CAMPEP_0119056056 /NCGR_PEP_ID=MMETSP1178-20130426/782_1 /TAXON_ID=33656 /ORGANISM="unid sp, Strain CCMP2000" /LENGTH=117 /DNA_ID=CAMNT_0007036745 /DNA_START=115 /DNA_END=468 /DNA_ORIENTATION=-